MSDTLKNKVVTIVFLIFLFGIFIINLCKTPTDVSKSERRKLAQFPEITWENVKNTKFMTDFATYTLDQFVARDTFRRIKAEFLFGVLKQKENNGIYIVNGQASKLLTELKEGELRETVKKINRLYQQYLMKMNVYYAIIPDKNYFLAEENGYPHIDYSKFEKIVAENIHSRIQPIDLFPYLKMEDYYTTDIHWKQENLKEVANQILESMQNGTQMTEKQWKENAKSPFYGSYYGQSALPLSAETLYYLTNEDMDKMVVKILNEGTMQWEEAKMYDVDAFQGIDPYNIYLSGPKALITIENPNSTTEKELIVFRDSFGSSLVPLLTTEYQKITLIDLRYLASPLLKNLVEFKAGQDVLILYSTEVLNNGSILKIM